MKPGRTISIMDSAVLSVVLAHWPQAGLNEILGKTFSS